jgi:hypothetical protein
VKRWLWMILAAWFALGVALNFRIARPAGPKTVSLVSQAAAVDRAPPSSAGAKEPGEGVLSFDVEPDDVEIYLDDHYLGRADELRGRSIEGILSGNRLVELRLGVERTFLQIVVPVHGTRTIQVSLAPPLLGGSAPTRYSPPETKEPAPARSFSPPTRSGASSESLEGGPRYAVPYDETLGRQLLVSIERGRHYDVLELLGRGADPNAKDPDGRTALMYAAINGQTDTMEVLIEKGAEINAKDRAGNTPLHCAAMFGDPNAVQLLINKGADLNARGDLGSDTRNVTALKLAKKRYQTAPAKRMSDVLARGRLILHAIKSDFERIMEMLERAGAVE